MKNKIKKLVALKLGVAIAMFCSGFAFCDQAAVVDVVMTIQALTVQRVSDGSASIMAAPGTSKVMDRIVFKNDGNGAVNYAVKVASTTGSWTLVSSVPGASEYRLSAIWHQWDSKPSTSEFQANDILTASDQTSSDTILFNDNESHATTGVKGYNVPTNEERNLYLKFDSPASGTGSSTAHVNVTAIAIP